MKPSSQDSRNLLEKYGRKVRMGLFEEVCDKETLVHGRHRMASRPTLQKRIIIYWLGSTATCYAIHIGRKFYYDTSLTSASSVLQFKGF